MPTYQYRCTACGNELEAVQRFTDPALTDCPDCTGQLRKVFNAVGVVFKGSGFYRTDSRSESKAKGTEATPAGAEKKSAEKSADSSSSTDKKTGKQPVAAGSANGGSAGSASKSASGGGSSTAA